MRRFASIVFLVILSVSVCASGTVTVVTPTGSLPRVKFGAEKVQTALTLAGYKVKSGMVLTKLKGRSTSILIGTAADTVMINTCKSLKLKFDKPLKKEGYSIRKVGKTWILRGNDASGALYACLELVERVKNERLLPDTMNFDDQPEMVLRGSCIGLQKPYYLPGHNVYEYPYTPETFPWFYDKALWIKYLDMLVDNRMNSLYLWNGHPFASLVKLKDYPFAQEVSDEDFRKNEEMFAFLTQEADKRGIWVIQMFYNIIVSKPFAEHYGIKTQDSHAPINPIVSDYTRKSIAEFIRKYPNVGLLVCLGEAINTYEDDVEWFTKTILPGVKDGLSQLGRTEEVPIILRAHDTNCEMVMHAALPIYKNLFTMNKYNGESLCTYQPGGPWAATHKALSELGSTHVDNVHILANLEPFRWSSPDFIQKSVGSMHSAHGANALHIYPQASYWDWPYTADKTTKRLLEMDRDRMWYEAWARYAWKQNRDSTAEFTYWSKELETTFGCQGQGSKILKAYEEMGEISPKLTRMLAITEGNRQTFLLGSFMTQLLNPGRWTVYPDFFASCSPNGERLAEWAQKEWNKQPHLDENPVQLAIEAENHGIAAVQALESVTDVRKNADEFARLLNDARAYKAFACCMNAKVKAAVLVLRYTYSNDISDLDKVRPFLEASLDYYRELVNLTKDTYLYANSMQTRQRRLPIGGDDGKNKTWLELLPNFAEELVSFDRNLARLKQPNQTPPIIQPLQPADVQCSYELVTLDQSPNAYLEKDAKILKYAAELKNLKGLRFNYEFQKTNPTEIKFSCKNPVSVLVGYFSTVSSNYAYAPKLETDASANDYGQSEIRLANALEIAGQPSINVHTYTFPAGDHILKINWGNVMILGFIDGTRPIAFRDAGFGDKTAIDWLFY
jgi:hypothetical protein